MAMMAATCLLATETGRWSPATLAIYYGYPSLINGAASNITAAAAEFGAYDIIVLGDGLEFPDHPDHESTHRILDMRRRTMRPAEVFGYVALGHPSDDTAFIERRVRLWARMGVTGIFYDEAGRDFGVTVDRITYAIGAAREHRLAVCFNAFDLSAIEEGLHDPDASAHLSSDDAILVESFGIRLSKRQSLTETAQRMGAVEALRRLSGVRVFGTTTTVADATVDARDRAFVRQLAEQFRLDALGWGDPEYAAKDSQLTGPPDTVSRRQR